MCIYQVMMTLHFLNDVAFDAVSTQKHNPYSLKSETIGKLINRIPGSRLLISSLPGKTLRRLVDIAMLPSILYISASLAMSTSLLKALPGKFDIKTPTLFI